MRIFAALAVAMLVFANGSATDDPVVPMVEEPRHRVLWGNSSMHILDLRIPPGDTTLFHTHDSPIFYITIQNSSIKDSTIRQGVASAPGAQSGCGSGKIK